jgi:cytosine/adenosine deaminase-related metal-dependent hydrolase
MEKSLVIKNGTVLLPNEELQQYDLLIENGQIRDLGRLLADRQEIDASGKYVLPGLIYLHTHGIRTVNLQAGMLHEYAQIEAALAPPLLPHPVRHPTAIAEQMRRIAETG